MSQWTHAAGLIVIDFLTPPDFSELHMDVPTGSEGPLEWRIHQGAGMLERGSYGMDRYTIIEVCGDLRDYENADEILDWFERACKSLTPQSVIRNAAITIDIEYKSDQIAIWRDGALLKFPVVEKKKVTEEVKVA